MADITLTRLTADDREQFILDNQRAFKYRALEEFGERLYPETKVWETCTPYFETRNIHFREDHEVICAVCFEKVVDICHQQVYRIY